MSRGATLLVSGTVLGQAAVLLSSPLLTRLYDPAQFGVLGVYASLLAGLTLIASLRYELAVPLPDRVEEGVAILAVSVVALVGTTAVTVIVTALFAEAIAAALKTPALAALLWLLPIGVFLGGANKCLTYWALRDKAFGAVARTRMQQGLGMAATQSGLGLLGVGTVGLVIGHVVGIAAGLAHLGAFTWRAVHAHIGGLTREGMRRMASRYRRFAIFSTWSDLANVIGGQAPFLILAAFYSPVVAGLYLLAHRVANAPAVLISESVGKAFMAGAVGARADGSLPRLSLGAFAILLRIGSGPLLIAAPLMPEIFIRAFGPQWREAGTLVQAIIPWMVCVVVFAPLSSLFAVLERQRGELAFQLTLLAARATALVVGARLGGPVLAVGLYALAASAAYIGFGWWLLTEAGVRSRDLVHRAAAELWPALLGGGVVLALTRVIPAGMPVAGISGFWVLVVFASAVLAWSLRRIVAGVRGFEGAAA